MSDFPSSDPGWPPGDCVGTGPGAGDRVRSGPEAGRRRRSEGLLMACLASLVCTRAARTVRPQPAPRGHPGTGRMA